jgi:hypothetical protein
MATIQPSSDIPSRQTSSTSSLYKEDTIPEKQEERPEPTTPEHPFEKWTPDQDAVEDARPAPPNPMDPASFPDGGTRAWLVVLGAFCCLIVSFGMLDHGFPLLVTLTWTGWINCVGVFQAYYLTHQLRNYSPQEVAWIPSLESFCMFAGGIWVGRIYDYHGPRWLLIVGTFLHVFGLMMASISTKYWHCKLRPPISPNIC